MHHEYFDQHARAMQAHRAERRAILNDEIEQPAVRELLGAALAGAAVLDIGSGAGENAAAYSTLCAHVTCIEQSEALASISRQRLGPDRATVINDDYLSVRFDVGSFDVVTANFMLGYFSDLPRSFAWVARVLRPRGTFVISGLHPVYMSVDRGLRDDSRITDYFASEAYITDFLDTGTPIALQRWRTGAVLHAARSAGLRVTEIIEPAWRPIKGVAECARRRLYRRLPTICIFRLEHADGHGDPGGCPCNGKTTRSDRPASTE